eukprot:1137763-Rhodomonas_salina.3
MGLCGLERCWLCGAVRKAPLQGEGVQGRDSESAPRMSCRVTGTEKLPDPDVACPVRALCDTTRNCLSPCSHGPDAPMMHGRVILE